MPARLVVAAAIVDSLAVPTRLLAARRSAPSRLAGWWEFPGGKVEPGEDPVDAVHRELAEELGVRVVLGDELLADADVAQDDPDHGLVWPLTAGLVLRLWPAELAGTLVDGAPKPLQEHDELRWLGAAALGSVPWLPADAAAVARCARLLGHNSPT